MADPSLDREYLDHLAARFQADSRTPHRRGRRQRLRDLSWLRSCWSGWARRSFAFAAPRTGATSICIAARSIWKPLRAKVLETGADLGVAFDGDADRALFVSHSGKIVDGDAVMLLTALPLHARGRLTEVVATVMSNLGPGARAEASRHRPGADCGRRQIRARRNAAPRRAVGRGTERPRYLSRLRHHRRRPADRAARAGSHALHRARIWTSSPRKSRLIRNCW